MANSEASLQGFFSSLLSAFSQLNKGLISAHLTELHRERDMILNY